jgi:hypothetical protein
MTIRTDEAGRTMPARSEDQDQGLSAHVLDNSGKLDSH